jgi:hypothetical protein
MNGLSAAGQAALRPFARDLNAQGRRPGAATVAGMSRQRAKNGASPLRFFNAEPH